MTTPAIGLIKKRFPQAEITILANPLVAQLFSPHAAVDRVITFDRNGRHRGIAGRFRLAAEIRSRAFDAVIILPNSFDSALIPWLARIPVRLGKCSDGRGLLLTACYRPGRSAPVRHEVEYYLNLVGHFGIGGQASPPLLCCTGEEIRCTAEMLAEQGIHEGGFIIGINPGATYGSA